MNDQRKHSQDDRDNVREAEAAAAGEDAAEGVGPETFDPEPLDEAATPGTEPVAEPVTEPTAEERLTAERDEFKDKWLRALADLDNQRKRSRREVDDARRFAQADLLRPLLDIADNFERALQAMDGSEEVTAAGVRQGVELIHQNFRTVLRDRGVEPIEAAGTEFDPALHEAVAQVPSADHAAGIVIDVVQQGYRFGDLVLRPARVVIAS